MITKNYLQPFYQHVLVFTLSQLKCFHAPYLDVSLIITPYMSDRSVGIFHMNYINAVKVSPTAD